MKWIILALCMALLFTGCDTAPENAKVTVDGKEYNITIQEGATVTSPAKQATTTANGFIPNDALNGYESPSNPKYFLIMNDKKMIYAIQGEPIPITSDIIRISKYYVQAEPGGKWFYHEDSIELKKGDFQLEQMRK